VLVLSCDNQKIRGTNSDSLHSVSIERTYFPEAPSACFGRPATDENRVLCTNHEPANDTRQARYCNRMLETAGEAHLAVASGKTIVEIS
jgi:hypothetical protein